MKLFILFLLIVLISCSSNSSDVALGGAEDVNTFVLVGTAYKEGAPASAVSVSLIPDGFDPRSESLVDSLTVVTNEDGTYQLNAPQEGIYALYLRDSSEEYSRLAFNLAVDSGTITRTDTLVRTGTAELSLPDQFDSAGTVSIPGTLFSFPLEGSSLSNRNGIVTVTIDNLPASRYETVLYQDSDTALDITDEEFLTVVSGSSSELTITEKWDSITVVESAISGVLATMNISNTGTIWIGTLNAGLFSWVSGQSWTQFSTAEDGSSIDTVRDLECHGDSVVVASNRNTLLGIGETFYNLSSGEAPVIGQDVHDLTILENGTIAGAYSTGIGLYRDDSWSFATYADGFPMGSITAIAGKDSATLFAVNNSMIYRYIKDEDRWSSVYNDNIYPNQMAIDGDSVLFATDLGIVTWNGAELTKDSTTDGWEVSSLSRSGNTLWTASSGTSRFYGIREHSSSFTYDNSPLTDTDSIVSIATYNEVVYILTQRGVLYTLQYVIN